MRVEYVECDCAMIANGLARADIVVLHYADEAEAVWAFVEHRRHYHCGAPGSHDSGVCCRFHSGRRYWSIHGPGGHIRAVEK